MKKHVVTRTTGLAIALVALTLPTAAWAHGAEVDGVPLHIGNEYGSCYFDLHSELTKGNCVRSQRREASSRSFEPCRLPTCWANTSSISRSR